MAFPEREINLRRNRFAQNIRFKPSIQPAFDFGEWRMANGEPQKRTIRHFAYGHLS